MQNERGYAGFLNYAKGKSFALIGLGVSNLPLIPFLLSSGAKSVSVRDLKKRESDPEVLEAMRWNADVFLGEEYLSDLREEVIIRSPGIRPDIPAFLEAAKIGSRITCETELFLEFCPAKSIAVTGSDGKTTTTTLIAKILQEDGWCVKLGGNIGKAMLPQLKEITNEKCVAVLELSSFQLMSCHFSPDISVITNLAENHLDWHKGMDEYLDAKKNILRHQGENGRAVLNFNNQHTKSCQVNGEKLYFSGKENSILPEEAGDGVFSLNGEIVLRQGKNIRSVIREDAILLPGRHNVENYMTAIAATAGLVSVDAVERVAKSFRGVEHRIELVRILNGVKYYNSSIDSSPSRTTAALNAFQEKIIMIAGGYDKHLDYTPLGDVICDHVKILILCGTTSEKIRRAVESSARYENGCPKIYLLNDFKETVETASRLATNGDCVVLTPASASFDQFRNFEERGKAFKELVMSL